MSLINDALKRARQAPPHVSQSPFPTLPPAVERPASVVVRLIPAIVIVLIVAAIFSIGWAMAHRSVQTLAMTPPAPVASAQPSAGQPAAPVAGTAPPVAIPPPVAGPAPTPSPALNPPDLPKLQGIYYSPTAPAAIVDGKTVRPGDQLLQYRVAKITKSVVTLTGTDGKTIKLSLDN